MYAYYIHQIKNIYIYLYQMRSISFSWKNMITNNVKDERELKQRAK